MVTASWALSVSGEPAEVLGIVADYANAAEWTPAVRSASKLSSGPLAVGTTFQQEIDIADGATEFSWKIKKLEVNSVVLKGKAKVEMHQWWWPARIKVKVEDRYYVQVGPNEQVTLVEYYGHVKVLGFGKILSPLFKSQWRDIKTGAREGLARLQGRPAEGAAGAKLGAEHDVQATPARGPAV